MFRGRSSLRGWEGRGKDAREPSSGAVSASRVFFREKSVRFLRGFLYLCRPRA